MQVAHSLPHASIYLPHRQTSSNTEVRSHTLFVDQRFHVVFPSDDKSCTILPNLTCSSPNSASITGLAHNTSKRTTPNEYTSDFFVSCCAR
uniref:Uncharacterized protein n=1 Tax=Helianthus annuus TaxID=4232 RepID=A0A251SBP6_HELAN